MLESKRWSSKKMGASKARQKRRPPGKRLGLKRYPGAQVQIGHIIVRQRSMKNFPGKNVAMGKDLSIYALTPGYVHFTEDKDLGRNYINVVEFDPKTVQLPTEWTPEFSSKLAGGWRADSVFTRDASSHRHFDLYDLNRLPPVKSSDLSALLFEPMKAHMKAMNLQDKLDTEKYQYPERFKVTGKKLLLESSGKK